MQWRRSFDIDDEDTTEKIKPIIDRRNWDRVYEMTKERNLTVGYHGIHIQIIPSLLQFPNMTWNQLIENLFIGNKRDNIPPFFWLNNNYVIHVQTKKCNHSEHYILRGIKVFMKANNNHAREENCCIDRITYRQIRDTTILWYRIL